MLTILLGSLLALWAITQAVSLRRRRRRASGPGGWQAAVTAELDRLAARAAEHLPMTRLPGPLGTTTAQALAAARQLGAALAATGVSTAEMTPGLEDDDRKWIRQMTDLGQTPGEQAERWLAAHAEGSDPDAR